MGIIIDRSGKNVGQFRIKADGCWFYITHKDSTQLVWVETTAEAACEFCAINTTLIVANLDPIEYLLKYGQILADKYLEDKQ